MTKPNGIAGTNNGIESAIARRSISFVHANPGREPDGCDGRRDADRLDDDGDPDIVARVPVHPDRYAPPVDLNGVWRVLPADDDLRRDAIGLDVDDNGWHEITVPGHWRNDPQFAESEGPLLYRRRFSLPEPAGDRRRWITLDGVFYQADIWLDGAYLGDPEGYFMPHSFDITALSRIGDEHVVAIEVACAPQSGHRGKRNITGIFQHWDGLDRTWNPGGLWRPVHVYDTGPVRVDRFRILCRDADETRAHLVLGARLDSDHARSVTIRTSIDGEPVHESERRMAKGLNEVNWNLDITDPALWWPRTLGDQPLTDVAVEVIVEGEVSDRRYRRTGLRVVAWQNWSCSVNGERIFLKGANLLPTRAGLADAAPAEMRRDVELAVEAGLDVLRVHGHIAPRTIYETADELGLLLLQDFPLQWGYARSVRGQAVEQARDAVDVLGHHPSIVLWNAHNDPAAVAIGIEGDSTRSRLQYVAAHQLPSWNKTVLDRWVKRAFERRDPTRLCVPHSGVLPHLPLLDGTDSHFYFGWYHGDVRDVERLAKAVPRVVRFMSEFGAQAVPESAEFIDASAWPDLDWEHLTVHHGLQKWVFDERVPPEGFETFEAWRHATQVYQAELLRHHIELLRRLKYRPAGGFCMFALNDPAPVVSWSVLDHDRRPKLGFFALRSACAPVIVVADRPPAIVTVGETVALDVHVVNDRRDPVDPAVVDVVVRWAGGDERWRFGGAVGSDECVKVGMIEFEVPDTLGALTIDLELTAGEIHATNHYATVVTVAPV
jgi:beta-mannosidase